MCLPEARGAEDFSADSGSRVRLTLSVTNGTDEAAEGGGMRFVGANSEGENVSGERESLPKETRRGQLSEQD